MRYTLVSDGSSDRALIPILNWSLRRERFFGPIAPAWADLSGIRNPPSALPQRIRLSLDLYPCDLLFVHRDAEAQPHELRTEQIDQAASGVPGLTVPIVPVVPVRMMEAWLLSSEAAIRSAAGNPSGTEPLAIPVTRHIEKLPNPKELLHGLLRSASGLGTRRREALTVHQRVYRISEYTDDFTPLEGLAAFMKFRAALNAALAAAPFI